MTHAEADSVLRSNGLRTFNNPLEFGNSNASCITLIEKNGIVTGFTWVCAPTSD